MSDLPPNAQLAFHGSIFDVYQWQQKLYDGTEVTFEKLKRTDTATVLALTADGQVIITKQQQPTLGEFLSLPGGRVDGSEDALAAAQRELKEETGYVSDQWRWWFSFKPFSKIIWTISVFVAEGCTKATEPTPDGGEKIVTQLVTPEEFLDQIIYKEEFRDDDVALKLLRLKRDPAALEALFHSKKVTSQS